MVDILLQVLADTLRETIGNIHSQDQTLGETNQRGQGFKTQLAQKPTLAGSPGPKGSRHRQVLLHNSEPRHKTTWDPSCTGVKVGKVIFNPIGLSQTKVIG